MVAQLDAWEVREYAPDDPRLPYFRKHGFAHVQLWHAPAELSILTPSRLTAGAFEVASPTDRAQVSSWPDVAVLLSRAGVPAPNRHEIRAIERWFVWPVESRAGRLLRSWWAGQAEAAR